MTYIQPDKRSWMNITLGVLITLVIFSAVWLIVLYNQLVSVKHSISKMQQETESIEARNAELKEQIFSLFANEGSEAALKNNLVKERNPQYLEISKQWVSALEY